MNNIQHLLLAYKNLKALSPISDKRLHKLHFMALDYVRELVESCILNLDFIKHLDKL